MISLKDYAKQNNITYEAVRAQVKRCHQELEEHIVRDGRTQYLDDVAVAFLDERRQKNPVVIYQQSKDEAIEAMRLELEGAYKKIAEQAVQITELQQFKLNTMEQRHLLEDTQAAQAVRERELAEREARMAEEIKTAAQEATEAAKQAADEHWVLEVLKAQEEAQKAREDDERRHQEELAAEQSRPISLKEWWARRKKGKD